MENYISKLAPRVLSLFGKVILLNTLTMSRVSYLSNVFPLNANTSIKIQKKKKFKYLWHNQVSELIARKKIILRKNLGGLNLIEPEI